MVSRLTTNAAGDAETIAIAALGYIAADETLMTRFLAMTGITASEIRLAARERGFLGGVLRFVTAHEPTLLAFAEEAQIEPGRIVRAAQALPGGDEAWDMQP